MERNHSLRVEVDGRSVAVGPSPPWIVGRDADCDIPIEDPRVSRHHLTITPTDSGWALADTSSNGTYRGAQPITTLEFDDPIVLRLGDPNDGPTLALTPAADDHDTDLGALSSIYRPTGATISIGREPANDVVLSDLGVSRFHAELRTEGGRATLTDLDSFNGTFVNGQPVHQCDIAGPDVITIGSHALRYDGVRLFEFIDRERVSLEAVGLSVPARSGTNIINGVSFVLPSNSLTAIVGPSGSGKTTLLKGLAGDRPNSAGTVLYRGRDLFDNLPALRPRFGFVPQDDVLHLDLTVAQSLGYAAALRFPPDTSREERSSRIDDVVAELGLTDRLHLPVRQLSGGQRKRVSVAFELITQPTVVFLDEPTSGLDPGYERSLMLTLRRLADGGRTLLLVTHATESLALCNRVLFLAKGGRIAYFGQPHQALEFFEADDYADLFRRLDQDTIDWAGRYRDLAGSAADTPIVERSSDEKPSEPRGRRGRRSPIRQLPTLVGRELALLRADWKRTLMLLLQGPLLGLLFFYALDKGEFALPDSLSPRYARMTIAALVLGITWIALAATIREIVDHRVIYQRERAVGLSPFAYVTAKVLVFGPFIIVEAAVFTVIATLAQDGPDGAVLLDSGLLEVIVGVAMVGLAAMALGLLVSAATSSSSQAMAIFPLLLVVQMLFSGLFPSITADPVGQGVSYTTSARWGLTAIASTVDLNRIEQYQNLILGFQQDGSRTVSGDAVQAVLDQWKTEGSGLLAGNLSAEEQQALPLVLVFVEVVEAHITGAPLPRLEADQWGELGNPGWDHDSGIWLGSIGALGGLFLAAYLGTWIVIRFRDRRRGP